MNKKQLSKTSMEKKEIFLLVCSALIDTGFSQQITYPLFKRQYYRFFIFSKNTKSINLNVKLSRSKFKVGNNLGNLNGFYRAI